MGARRAVLLLGIVAVAVILVFVIPRASGVRRDAGPMMWPTEDWVRGEPETQGIDSNLLADALLTIREKDIRIHSLLLIRHGVAILDAVFYPYDGTMVHDLASVTKSVTTTLIGIAADQGKLTLDQPVVSFFPDRPIANRDARKERMTVKDLLTMSSGLDCTRAGGEATLQEMKASPDWVQFVLDRPVRWEPGTHFVYCSPGSHLLSAILQQATGMTALEFARANLFGPLRIRDVLWTADPQGVTSGPGDLRLHPRDAAKLGLLWLAHGVWEGKQIVSPRWVEAAVKPHIKSDGDDYYGYGWWISLPEETGDIASYRADGRGGQYVAVVPSWNLIVATTGGGFDLDQIAPLLIPALVDVKKPLPANPAGVARLAAAVGSVANPPAPEPVALLPAVATAISGETVVFDRNPLGITGMVLTFGTPAEATVRLILAGGRAAPPWPVGLDGVYRMSTDLEGFPLGMRGRWTDAQTFILEYNGIVSNDQMILRLRFAGDRVVVEARGDIAQPTSATFSGRLQRP
jgi:CubicO group peptidase (beta-lactamase class C family)